jgi:hypothetical protein
MGALLQRDMENLHQDFFEEWLPEDYVNDVPR